MHVESDRLLGPGERATVMVIATDRKQARTITRYVRGLIFGAPMLAAMVERETQESLDLRNGAVIEVQTASYRTVRGYSIAAALCDELAFWPSDDSAEPDYEVLDALRPGMATMPEAMLLCASSPYAQRGALHDAFRRHYGKDGPVLVWKASTRVMNCTVSQSIIDAARERDPLHAASEYDAEFRRDIAGFVDPAVVNACVPRGVFEREPIGGIDFVAFCDPSGGSADAMTLAVAHREDPNRGVLDCVRERRPPFSPDDVVAEFAALLASYNVTTVRGDRYAGGWPRERFRAHGVEYEPAEKPKSDIYRDLLPMLNSRRCELLDLPRLTAQLCGLERRTARGGRDSIDHASGGHDDVANAVAGVLVAVGGYDPLGVWEKLV